MVEVLQVALSNNDPGKDYLGGGGFRHVFKAYNIKTYFRNRYTTP